MIVHNTFNRFNNGMTIMDSIQEILSLFYCGLFMLLRISLLLADSFEQLNVDSFDLTDKQRLNVSRILQNYSPQTPPPW